MPPVPKPKHERAPHYIGAWRKHREKTQDQVADYLGVEQSTVSKLERGISPYDQDVLERLAYLFDCEAADLLAINPFDPDKPRLVYDQLRNAPPLLQQRALAVLGALLRAG